VNLPAGQIKGELAEPGWCARLGEAVCEILNLRRYGKLKPAADQENDQRCKSPIIFAFLRYALERISSRFVRLAALQRQQRL
jgi:hypothetical protein